MNARISDETSLGALMPGEVTAYLSSTGWSLKGFFAQTATVWSKNDEVLQVPRERRFADYARRMSEVVEALAGLEDRSQLEVYRDLTVATSDVIRVRVASSVARDGSLGFEAGVRLVQSTQEMVQAAARAAVAPRPSYRGRLPADADEFLKNARLGQTEQGSYVITIVCPITPELNGGERHLETDLPFDRQVTTLLALSLHKTTLAANEASIRSDLRPFIDAVPFGVSANLCDAVASLGEVAGDGDVEISFAWSRSRKAPAVPSSRIQVPRELISFVREAGRMLGEGVWDGDLEVEGIVTTLRRDNPQQLGEVMVKTPWGKRWRKVNLWLKPTDYDKALAANKDGSTVYARGVIERQGQSYEMKEVLSFGIQPD
jgi:hypothetical protein